MGSMPSYKVTWLEGLQSRSVPQAILMRQIWGRQCWLRCLAALSLNHVGHEILKPSSALLARDLLQGEILLMACADLSDDEEVELENETPDSSPTQAGSAGAGASASEDDCAAPAAKRRKSQVGFDGLQKPRYCGQICKPPRNSRIGDGWQVETCLSNAAT